MNRSGSGDSKYGLAMVLLAGACFLYLAGCSKKALEEPPDRIEESAAASNSPAVKWKFKVGRKFGAAVRLGEGVVEIPYKIPPKVRESIWRQRIKRPKPTNNNVYVLDAKTGRELRSYTEKKEPDPTQFTAGGLTFTSSMDTDSTSSWTLSVADSKTNKELWTMSLPTDLKDEPQIQGNTVYLQTQKDDLLAIDARNGQKRWEYPGGKFSNGKPWLFPGRVCLRVSIYRCGGCGGKIGRRTPELDGPWLVGIDSRTGKEVWKKAYPERSRLFATKRTLLVLSREKLYAVDFRDGRVLWETDVPKWHSHDWSASSYLLGEVLTFRTLDGYQRGFEARTGAEKWRVWRGDLKKSKSVVVDTDIYISTDDGMILALDSQTGISRWRFNAGAQLAKAPDVEGNRLFATSVDGYLWVIDRASGEEVWRFKDVLLHRRERSVRVSEKMRLS